MQLQKSEDKNSFFFLFVITLFKCSVQCKSKRVKPPFFRFPLRLSYWLQLLPTAFLILYCNVDGLLDGKDELISIIDKDQPIILALGEIKPIRQYDFNIAEYNIPGYTLFVNNKIKRAVAIYAHVSLNAQLFNTLSDSGYEESVWCQFSTLNNTKVLLGCIYKVPIQQNKM